MFVHVCVLGWVCLPGEKQKQGGIFSGQLCAAYPPWWEGVEGHYWFPRQPRQRPDDCERVPGETVKYTQFLLHAESLFKIYANECKKLLRLPRTACYDWFFFLVFFLPQSRNSHIFIYFYFTCPSTCSIVLSSCLSSPSDSPSADLYREERGDWRLPPAEQREEEGPGSCEVSARNMTVLLSPWPSFCYSDGGILRSV